MECKIHNRNALIKTIKLFISRSVLDESQSLSLRIQKINIKDYMYVRFWSLTILKKMSFTTPSFAVKKSPFHTETNEIMKLIIILKFIVFYKKTSIIIIISIHLIWFIYNTLLKDYMDFKKVNRLSKLLLTILLMMTFKTRLVYGFFYKNINFG